MAGVMSKTPYVPQDVNEVQSLIQKLTEGQAGDRKSRKDSFSCRRNSFTITSSPENLTVNSWRFHDWDYKRPDLPTYARGLFTGKNEYNEDEIVSRGYDKFFNVEEVKATKWQNIEANTKGPYELSIKENGCIIFISGLRDGSLLVCSKHSTGPREDGASHAIAGEKWIDKQLAAIGRTREQLAKELRFRNATAVAELCDDSFEEHILPYEKEKAGLYLHGININSPRFITYPGDQVQEFAEQWGFQKTDFLVFNEIQATRKFLEHVADTGSYNSRDIEGFVIRCQARHDSQGLYEDWFFKYKFEEPYLMYRQWRECTKSIITGKTPRFKKHKAITEEYLLFAQKKLTEDPSLKKAYLDNHGIIKLRNDFLGEKKLKGSDIIRQEYAANGDVLQNVVSNVILVPIATLGCGKTTIGVALGKLFGWGHVQNDNIIGKGRPARFTKELLATLEKLPVVFADRNNSRGHERTQLLNDLCRNHPHPHPRVIALHFVHEKESIGEIRKLTQSRVFARGDNHQTIQASTSKEKTMGIMENFVKSFQPININSEPDSGFHAVIDLDPLLPSRKNLETVVSELRRIFPKLVPEIPTSEELDDAINFARNEYKPALRHEINAGKHTQNQNQIQCQNNNQAMAKPKNIEYFSVTLETPQILQIVRETFSTVSLDEAHFWKQLNSTNRVQNEFHVTLIHRASAKAHPQLWQKYCDLYNGQKMGTCRVFLESIVWDDRLMAIVVRLVDDGWECVNQVAHITIGTRDNEVKPKESNNLLRQWIEVGSGDHSRIRQAAVQGHQVIDGSVIGVPSR
ncbi:tRNA ligase 1 [Podosphaera aphanis]|nr:tRNA ligase 1 [Podosphaera aphanis]